MTTNYFKHINAKMVHSASESYSSRYTADNNKILYNGVCSSGKFFTWQINLKFQTSTTIF